MNNSEVAEIGLLIRQLQKEHERPSAKKGRLMQCSQKRKKGKTGLQRTIRLQIEENADQNDYSDIYRKAITAEVLRGK